ncbi:MAG: hypothetical protein OXF57_08910, partial [Rhodospirillaceae bacterium]|nr:hypothetical protein [Rhodospirillaceae bacterium]
MAISVSPNDTAGAAGSGAGDWNQARILRQIARQRQSGRAASRLDGTISSHRETAFGQRVSMMRTTFSQRARVPRRPRPEHWRRGEPHPEIPIRKSYDRRVREEVILS